jgi:hypothetical protein
MIDLACSDSRSLMTRRRAGLPEPDRLRLEHHLEGCAQCRFDAAVLDGIARAVTEPEAEPDAASALERAMRVEPVRTKSRRTAPFVWLAAAAVLIAVVAGAVALGSGEPEVAARPHEAQEERGHLVAVRPMRITVAHARVRTHADTEIEWHDATLVLLRGRVSADVDPSAHRAFRVRTEHFDVEVTGTAFDVTAERVRVRRGSVRVVDPSGAVLDPHVGAGESWSLRAEPTAARAVVPQRVDPSEPVAPRPHVRARPEQPQLDARARFERAVRSEASEPDGALAEYHAIEREGGAWAPNAAFARGRLLHELGRTSEARAVLERYLARWPRGPNAEDARLLLAAAREARIGARETTP